MLERERLMKITATTLVVCYTILLGFVAGDIKKVDTNMVVQSRMVEDRPVFGTYIKEPMVVEKEVIVYMEPEPVIEEFVEVEYIPEPSAEYQYIGEYFDVFSPSNYTYEDIISALGPERSGLHHVAGAFVNAEDVYGVNALYLMATIGLESGWGKYRSATNNLAGWKGGPNGTFSEFSTEAECIMTVAEGLATRFLPSVGNTLLGVTGRYCPEPTYMDKVIRIMNDLQNNLF